MKYTSAKDLLQELLSGEGPLHGAAIVRVVVDTTVEGVDLPPSCMEDRLTALDLSYAFDDQYPVLLEDDAVHARLQFPAGVYECVIPWAAILEMRSAPGVKPAPPALRFVAGGGRD